MAMLDKRLKRMEERIIKIIPKEEQDGTAAAVTRAIVKPGIPGAATVKNINSKKRPADEAFAQELDHWSKSVSNSNIDGGGSKPMPLMIQEAEENRLLTEGAEALPSKELQEHLSEIFFENVNGQTYHLLHKPSFMRKLRYVMRSTSANLLMLTSSQGWNGSTCFDSGRLCHFCTVLNTSKTRDISSIPER
tara:strand:- start:53 stop:625 length:573 start_codon:yes stop_codon:yes gene_type:complete